MWTTTVLAWSTPIALPELCSLPEDAEVVRAYVLERVGGEISNAAVDLLREEFELLKDDMGYDTFHALEVYFKRTAHQDKAKRPYFNVHDEEKVRIVYLRKRCTATDGVGYNVDIGATIEQTGRAIFSQFFVGYSYEDILAGRRPFSFEKFGEWEREFLGWDKKIPAEILRTELALNKEISTLIMAETAGFTSDQLNAYMDKLGCVKGTDPRLKAVYYYNPDPENYFWTRLVKFPFAIGSREISVEANDDGTGQSVRVRGTSYDPQGYK